VGVVRQFLLAPDFWLGQFSVFWAQIDLVLMVLIRLTRFDGLASAFSPFLGEEQIKGDVLS
jgi:hypothetical protein